MEPLPKPPRFTVEEMVEAVLDIRRLYEMEGTEYATMAVVALNLKWIGKAREGLEEIKRIDWLEINSAYKAWRIAQRVLADLEGLQ